MVEGVRIAVAVGEATACVSAGHSGVTLAAATPLIGRIHGVSRSGLAAVLPGANGPAVPIDAGANLWRHCPGSEPRWTPIRMAVHTSSAPRPSRSSPRLFAPCWYCRGLSLCSRRCALRPRWHD
ncbi:MAG: hypothetical protein EXQ67_01555 [Thermoleophilia bacterium]|nr:hypothetical protein [Thermoleophilia bacterium]